MKIILEKRVEKLGLPGEIVTVADGYARNFLIPKKMAVLATKNNVNKVNKMLKKLELEHVKEVEEAKKIAEEIEKLEIKLVVQAGENDKLFGAVTNIQISEALQEKGVSIEKKKILIAAPIKQLGEFQVDVKIHPDVIAKLKVIIDKKEEE